MHRCALPFLFLVATILLPLGVAASDEHASAELIAEQRGVQPGTHTWVGIKLKHDAHWHTYWTNPGDSGLPTQLSWRLPNGFRAHPVLWPAPTRFIAGDIHNFGYDGTVLLPVMIDIPQQAPVGSVVPLAVDAKWVVCSVDLCIPGKATLRLNLPVTAQAMADQSAAPLFAAARASVPKAMNWPASMRVEGERIRIELRGVNLPRNEHFDFFPVAPNVLANTPMTLTEHNDRWLIDARRSEYFTASTTPSLNTLSLVIVRKNVEPAQAWPQAWQVVVPWPKP